MNLNQVTVASTDIAASKSFYTLLGLNLIVDAGHYLRFECPQGESTFSVQLSEGSIDETKTKVYFETAELDKEVNRLVELGIKFDLLPKDQPWLWREAHLKDPAGNPLILYFAGSNRKSPPWKVNS